MLHPSPATYLRLAVTIAVLIAFSAALGADERVDPPSGEIAGNPFARERVEWHVVPAAVELAATLDTLAMIPVSDWPGADQIEVWRLTATADAEFERIRRAGRLSMIVAGLGHYANGSFATAAAFAAADALIAATGLVLVGLALPPAVHPRNVDYLQRSFLEVETIWHDVTPIELLPATVVAVAFAALQLTVRGFAASDAEWTTLDALRSGRIRVQPRTMVHSRR